MLQGISADGKLRAARRLQYLIAAVFLGLGGWCVVAPTSVIKLTVNPEYQSDAAILAIAMGAFGAQAMLGGLVIATSRFTAATFAALGLAMLPFFVFNWWFYFVTPVFNELILLDVGGNLLMAALCFKGYRLLSP